MEWLDQNLEAFIDRVEDPVIHQGEPWEEERYAASATKTGDNNLQYTENGKTRYVHSRFNPIEEGKKFAAQYKKKIESSNVIVLFGMGFGYEVRGFLSIMNPNNQIIIYEPSWHIFKMALQHADLRQLFTDERISFIFGKDFQLVKKYLDSFIDIENYEKLLYTVLPFYNEIYLEEYKRFTAELLQTTTERRILFETYRGWGKTWTESVVANINHLSKSYPMNRFYNVFPDSPVIVVAAGPSLNKNVHLLKDIQGKFPIVCVYTAYKVLQKNGIRPDFILTLDSSQTKYETEAAKKEMFDIPIVYLCIANTELLNRFTNVKIYCHTEHDCIIKEIMPSSFYGVDSIYVGGSVAVSAIHFATYIGGNPVIIVGMDLAYTDDRDHAAGTFYDNVAPSVKAPVDVRWLPGALGGTVKSTLMFENYVQSTEALIQMNNLITYIDATEGGALKKGSIIDTLQNTLYTYREKGVEDVTAVINQQCKNKKILNRIESKKIFKNLCTHKRMLVRLLTYLKEGKALSEKVLDLFTYGKPDEPTTRKIVDQYYKLDDKINDIMDNTPLFWAMRERIKFLLKADQRDNNVRKEIYFAKHSILLYKDMIEVTEKVDKRLVEQITLVEKRLDRKRPHKRVYKRRRVK